MFTLFRKSWDRMQVYTGWVLVFTLVRKSLERRHFRNQMTDWSPIPLPNEVSIASGRKAVPPTC